MSACPLCQPLEPIWQNDKLAVINAQDPLFPNFTRLVWRAHVAEMSDLCFADRQYVWAILHEIEMAQRTVLSPDKINLAAFGNQVPHLHWHIIPRYRQDPKFPGSVWEPEQRPLDSHYIAEQSRLQPTYELYLRTQLNSL